MNIGKLKFDNNVFLAPMAGVTDIAFRGLCKEMGCNLVYTEMISAKGLYYGNDKTSQLLAISEEEKPVAVQLFGNDPYIMAKAAETFENNNDFCIIDVNMGCPMPKIVKNGEGSALMKNPKLAKEIIKEMKKATSKPVTVKFRKGFYNDEILAVDFARHMEEVNVDAIAVHGRTKEQLYSGKADWNIIKDVKSSVSVPVIGNGDIFKVEDAEKIISYTNCDGIMIARGAMGNPWIFKEIYDKLNGKEVKYPSNTDKINMCIRHYNLAVKYNGEFKAVREMRKHIGWYIKSMPHSTELKDNINRIDDFKTAISYLERFKEKIN